MKTMNQVNQSQDPARVSSETLRAAEADGQSGLAGRELDAAVAERVMGWYWGPIRSEEWRAEYPTLVESQWELRSPSGSYWYLWSKSKWSEWACIPRYSTDIAAAMEVVEKMSPQDGSFTVTMHNNRKGAWLVEFWAKGKCESGGWSLTLPEAICRAALQATESSEAK